VGALIHVIVLAQISAVDGLLIGVGVLFLFFAIIGTVLFPRLDTVLPLTTPIRIGLGILGSFLLTTGLLIGPLNSFITRPSAPLPTTSPTTGPEVVGRGITIYSDSANDTTNHNLELQGLAAKSQHNPPQVHDRLTVDYSLRNVSGQPLTLGCAFIAARSPDQENRDFGNQHCDKVLNPGQALTVETSFILTSAGVWRFWPCYRLADEFCPNNWRAFEVYVEP